MVLPAKAVLYKNVWKIETKVNIMDIKEICAEKIRATSDRARYRDFYDLVLLFESFEFDIEEMTELVKQKEIRKSIDFVDAVVAATCVINEAIDRLCEEIINIYEDLKEDKENLGVLPQKWLAFLEEVIEN